MPMIEELLPLLPRTAGVLVIVLSLVAIHLWLKRRPDASVKSFRNQVVMIALTAAAGIGVIMILPLDSEARGQLLSFFGILISAAIALSSTTFLGNALAGLMLQSVKNFRIGDFIRVEDHTGRVTERGLFHTEIQTENRNLTTLSNMYLVTHPVTTFRTSGTIVSASVTLGYDVSRRKIESLLLEAAESTGLKDPYVQIVDLGDFSVEYRIAGLLEDVKQLIRTRSTLRAKMLDSLHQGGVEIVSPNFMNQRVLKPDSQIIPPPDVETPAAIDQVAAVPEEIIFDKADEAEANAALAHQLKKLIEQMDALSEELKGLPEAERDALQARLELMKQQKTGLEEAIAAAKAKQNDGE